VAGRLDPLFLQFCEPRVKCPFRILSIRGVHCSGTHPVFRRHVPWSGGAARTKRAGSPPT
jgi:hypothetical protein